MFAFIGDVHGCHEELSMLLAQIPDGHKPVFVGDLTDRGPDSVGVLRLVMGMVREGKALAVRGNHDDKLFRALSGKDVKTSHGLAETLSQLSRETETFRNEVREFLGNLPIELILADDSISVSHAGLSEDLQGKNNSKAKGRALFGKTTGKNDANGLPERMDWAQEYHGGRIVVHGHTVMQNVRNLNNVWCIDTGCCFGGKLTALCFPGMQVLDVKALAVYSPRDDFETD